MKKHTYFSLLGAVLIFVGCSKDNDITQPPTKPVDPPIPPVPTAYYYPPVLRISTEYGVAIDSKDYYVNADVVIESRDSSGVTKEQILNVKTEIKGRGNSTWGMEKKPYRLKLEDKAEVLGMPANKHWVLLANYSDKTLIRNQLAFEISRRMGFAYTPRMEYVDVYLNGRFEGNYLLGEHIRVDAERVNVPELKASSQNITGGYLLEIDEREGEPFFFKTEKGNITFCIKSPEDIPANQMEYISKHVQKVEDILYGVTNGIIEEELPKYLDMKSFIDYYLLNELAKNVDGNLRLSTFVYKKKDDDKLYFGPVWDYDISFGNADYDGGQNTTGWISRYASWYGKFFASPEFTQMVKDRWKALRANELKDLNTFIDGTSVKLTKSQKANFERWNILDKWVWPNPQVARSYNGEVTYLKNWLKERLDWMDGQLK